MRRLPGALLLLAGLALPAAAHIVPVGVGTQTELRVSPRRIRLTFNLGFSTVMGLEELRRMDANGDGSVDQAEQAAYVAELGKTILRQLRLELDGEPLPLTVLEAQGVGILGPIESVGFDTFYVLEAPCRIGPGRHRLVYHEGTYEGGPAEQLLWIPQDQVRGWTAFEASTPSGAPPHHGQGMHRHLGRDLVIELEPSPETLERDRAEALVEPWLGGLERLGAALGERVRADLQSELSGLAFGAVDLGRPGAGITIEGGAAVAQERVVPGAPAAAATPAEPASELVYSEDTDEQTRRMISALRQPFSLLLLLVFAGWGATHALLPGHGKTMVAAYLLGTAGRVVDALKLGVIVTFTHTFALYTAGLLLVWVVESYGAAQGQTFQRKLTQHVTVLSGLTLIAYGWWLASARWAAMRRKKDDHEHQHDHDHGHGHDHAHGHEGMSPEEHARVHAAEAASVSSFRDLLVLGITGGLAPCPAGVVLVLYSLTLPGDNTLKCFIYLLAFSIGLGSVLVGIALALVLSRRYLVGDAGQRAARSGWVRALPVVTALLISLVGAGLVYQGWAEDPSFQRLRARVTGR